MLRKIFPAVLVVLLLMLTACQGTDPGSLTQAVKVDATLDPTALLVGTDATFPPFESLDAPRRQIVGFDIDLMYLIARQAGLNVEIVGTRYGELLNGVADCRYAAAISAIPITEDLQDQMLFSEAYFVNGQVVVVKQGNIRISGPQSLAGMTVGVQNNSLSGLEAAKLEGVQIASYPTAELAFGDLIDGMIDAVVADKLLALSFVSVKPNKLALAGDEFATERYGIAVCKQNPELLQKINAALADFQRDNTLTNLQTKWLNTP